MTDIFINDSRPKDQYADGKCANIYDVFIGGSDSRTENYKDFLLKRLRDKGCRRILDVACGTGIDSIMLLEEGFDVVSTDGSDKMLKYALKTRWERKDEKAFRNWVIEEANWVTLYDQIKDLIEDGFDAIICFGSSFAHLLDTYGDQREQKQALKNFEKCLKPGGLLLMDHRNYDRLVNTGGAPTKCVFYDSKNITDIKTSVLYERGKPALVIRDYRIDTSSKNGGQNGEFGEFRLMFHPHTLEGFKIMLREAFGDDSKYSVYGDFLPLDKIDNPSFYIHVVEKGDF